MPVEVRTTLILTLLVLNKQNPNKRKNALVPPQQTLTFLSCGSKLQSRRFSLTHVCVASLLLHKEKKRNLHKFPFITKFNSKMGNPFNLYNFVN